MSGRLSVVNRALRYGIRAVKGDMEPIGARDEIPMFLAMRGVKIGKSETRNPNEISMTKS
jgi:hypothetical protein